VIHCFFRSHTKRVGALRRKLVSRGLLISTRQSRYRRYSLFFYLALARSLRSDQLQLIITLIAKKTNNYNLRVETETGRKDCIWRGLWRACMRRVAGFRRALAKRNEAKAECRMKDGVDAQCDAQVQQSVVYMTGRPCEATRSTAPGQRVRGV